MAFTKPTFKNPADRIIAAFDRSAWTPEIHRSLFKLRPYVGMIKVGAEAITARGTYASVADDLTVILGLSDWNYMYDLKIKEISNSTVRAVRNLAERRFPPSIATVHATQRIETIAAALEAAKGSPMLMAGVSVLSDHEPEDVETIYNRSLEEVIIGCAERIRVASEKVVVTAGMVCAPMDLLALREHGGWRYDSLIKIAVGIRPDGAPQNDQKRAMTPAEAIRAGADYLVIGRPIFDSPDPVGAAKRIVDEIASVS